MDRQHFVYVIAMVTEKGPSMPVKIGFSASPQQRLWMLQTSNAAPLKLIFQFAFADKATAQEIERDCHRRAAKLRMEGEWFELTPAIALHCVREVIEEFFDKQSPDNWMTKTEALYECGVYHSMEMVAVLWPNYINEWNALKIIDREVIAHSTFESLISAPASKVDEG